MVRGFALASVFLALAAPVSAAPGFTPAFPAGDGMIARPAMAPDGTVVVAEQPANVRVRPPGGSLGEVQALGGATSSSLTVAAGGDGRFVAAWVESGDVRVATLLPGTTSFGSPTTVAPEAETAQEVELAVDASGNATALWWTVDPTGGGASASRLRATVIPADGSPPSSQLLDETSAPAGISLGYLHPAIALNSNGAGVAGWVQTLLDTGTGTRAAYLRDALRRAGETFGAPQLRDQAAAADPPNNASEYLNAPPSVAINDAGDVGVAWVKGKNNQGPELKYVGGTLETLGPDEQPVPSGTVFGAPQIVLDQDGRTTLALLGLPDNKTPIRPIVVFRPRGGPFGGLEPLLDRPDNNAYVVLVASRAGNELLVYTSAAASFDVRAVAAERGASFGPPHTIVSDLSASAQASAGLGPSGDGVVLWRPNDRQTVTAVGYDHSPPVLRDLTIPSSLTAGSSALFSVQPFDIWGPVTSSWAFGDGGSADGASVSHTFDSAGDRTVSVTATDGVGNASTASGPVSVSALPVPAGPTPPAPDTTKPAISSFAATPSTFAVGPKSTPLVARVARRTTFRFQLSEPGSVTIAIARQLRGKRSGKRCVPPSKKLAKKKSCKRYKTVGTLKRTGVGGANKVAFTGRLGKKALALGRYRASIVATDPAGNKSVAKTASFKIVKFR